MSESVQMMEAFKALKVSAPILSRREYFERTHGDREPMKALGKSCHDCAITCGFYTPYAEDLAKEDEAFQDRIAERWFCHNHPNRACAGVREFLDQAKEPRP